MPRLIKPQPKDLITAEWGGAVVDSIVDLQKGPEVVAPLAKLDGAIYIGQEFEIKAAKTSGTIPARAGTQWGKGTAQFLVVSAAGVESTSTGAGGLPAEVWNKFGAPISANIRVDLAWQNDRWVIIGGDCSGVA